MARFRKIHPRIWNDEKFREFTDNGKLVFFYLLTTPHQTSLGAMRHSIPGMAAEMGWDLEAFREAFQEALSVGMAEYDSDACFVWLPNFLKYNRPESPNVVKAWAGSFELLPECDLQNQLLRQLKAFTEGLGEAFQEAFQEAFREALQ